MYRSGQEEQPGVHCLCMSHVPYSVPFIDILCTSFKCIISNSVTAIAVFDNTAKSKMKERNIVKTIYLLLCTYIHML